MTTYEAAYRVEVRTSSGRSVLTVDQAGGGKPLDEGGAQALADILRGGRGDHEVVVSKAPPTQLQVWNMLLALANETGVLPDSIQVTDFHRIHISLPRNERGQVETWRLRLGIEELATLGKPNYGHALYRVSGDAALLPGWEVELHCGVDTQARAGVHGDGLESPDPDEHAAWKAARETAEAPKRTILTHCNWIGGCDEPLTEADGSLLCRKHPTMDEIINGARDEVRA